jgi:hypothetical protein
MDVGEINYMCRKPNYTPKEAVEKENIVKIALWNGKVFHAGIVDVFDNGEKLHIVRLNKGRIVRREVLKIDYGPGNIRVISRPDCKYPLKGITGNNVFPVNGKAPVYRNMSKNTQGIINKGESPSREFLDFMEEQKKFFAQRKIDCERMNYKIQRAEARLLA